MSLHISEPIPIDPDALKRIAARLRAILFDEEHCGQRLGRVGDLPDFSGARASRPYVQLSSDPLDIAIALFLLNEEVLIEKACQLFDASDLQLMSEMSFVRINGERVSSHLNLFPCRGNYFVTDRAAAPDRDRLPMNRVMWLYHESYILAGLVDRTTYVRAALDLGTGSGIHALLASRHSHEAIGIDINPRAIAFSRFNQRLNNRSNLHYLLGDLYDPVQGRQFDLIVANPPYNPTPFVPAGADYWSGGRSGEEILSRIISGLDAHLTDNGICHIITLLCHHKYGPSYREKLELWLSGGLHRFDVLAQVMDGEYYFSNAASGDLQKFLKMHFARFEFGTLSFRKKRASAGFYYHGPPIALPPFFDETGRFAMSIDHDFFDKCKVLSCS